MPNLNDELEKLHHIYDQLDLLYEQKSSALSDFNKRALLRFYFVALDNLLKIVGWIKNETRRISKLNVAEIQSLEVHISTLRHSYDAAYDLIRDKLTAHQQKVDLVNTITWWNEIDSTTIEIFHSDVSAIRSGLAKAYPPLAIKIGSLVLDTSDEHPTVDSSRVQMNVTRLSIAMPNAVSLVPSDGSQAKGAMVTAALRFLRSDFYFTLKGENWQSKQQHLLFEIAWLLATIDIMSILDCIYDDQKEPSLLTLWTTENICGAPHLSRFQRDPILYAEMREVRNKFGAHLDGAMPLKSSRKLFENLDLSRVHGYCLSLANSFLDACRADVRTKLFLTDELEIDGVIATQGDASTPFAQ